MTAPLRFVFGLHLHQPVGNFDHVMADHVRDVYRPIIERATAAGLLPLTLHVSGPLLEWLEQHDTAWLDMIGRLAADLRELRSQGHGLAVLADDGEKFGGWPGTKDWVYGSGWLDTFLRTMEQLTAAGEITLATGQEAFREVPSGGLAYLGTASYREMETWALPPAAQRDLTRLEEELGPKDLEASAAFVRGGHWHHFLVKYPESNRMHKTMVALSALSRSRGDPPEARRAIGRAQCNDAYWHGVFGGLYLPHLRNAIWRQLAIAERVLRQGESLAYEELDLDDDGYPELWIHSAQFSAVISPHRGGAVETLTRFSDLTNLADVLTRRRESYHELPKEQAQGHGDAGGGTASIHDIEKASRLTVHAPVDAEPRAILVERLLGNDVSADDYASGRYTAVRSWAATPLRARVSLSADAVTVVLQGDDLEKQLMFDQAGCLDVAYTWNAAAAPANAVFAPELSLAREVPLRLQPDAEVWRSDITTVARSERGFEETVQGVSLTPRWPARLGACSLELG